MLKQAPFCSYSRKYPWAKHLLPAAFFGGFSLWTWGVVAAQPCWAWQLFNQERVAKTQRKWRIFFFPLPASKIWFSFVSLHTWKIRIKPSDLMKWGFVPLKQGWSGRRCCPYLKGWRKISCCCWLSMAAFPFSVFGPSGLPNSCWERVFSVGELWKDCSFSALLISWELWCGLFPPVLQNGEQGRCLSYFLCTFPCWESWDEFGSFSFSPAFVEEIRGVTCSVWKLMKHWQIKKIEQKQCENSNIFLKHDLSGAKTQNEWPALCRGRARMKSQLFFEPPLQWLQRRFVKMRPQFARFDSTWTRLSHLFKAALFSEPQNMGQQTGEHMSRLIKQKWKTH